MFKIEFDPRIGRYLKALCDIAPGTVIIDEPSIVDGPCVDNSLSSSFSTVPQVGYAGLSRDDQPEPSKVCPACYKKLSDVDVDLDLDAGQQKCSSESSGVIVPIHCPTCDLILCSTKCVGSLTHRKNECLIFCQVPALLANVFRHPCRTTLLCQFITTVRCLFLKTTDSFKWNQLLQLQSNVKEFEERGIFNEIDEGFALLKWSIFSSDSEQSDPPTSAEIVHETDDIIQAAHMCLGILRTNAFSQLTNEIGVERLFFFSSFMAHDCLMNTDRYFCPSDSGNGASTAGRMVTKAAVKIHQGESITTTYMSFLASTPERQNDMERVWNFYCTCSRCADPTECDTNLSTIKCPNCALVTFSAFYSVENKACMWSCSNCAHRITSKETQNILEGTVHPIETERPDVLTNLEDTERWLDSYDNGQVLHSNHSILTQVKYFLCQYYGNETGNGLAELSDARLLRKANYCRHTLNVLDKLFNGVYVFKGSVLFHLWLALKEIARRIEQDRSEVGKFGKIMDKESLSQIAELAHNILRHGDPNSSEELMANVLSCDDATLFQSFNKA